MIVDVDGKKHEWNGDKISYEQIIALAGVTECVSISYYTRGLPDMFKSGILYKGKSVDIVTGLHFDCMRQTNISQIICWCFSVDNREYPLQFGGW